MAKGISASPSKADKHMVHIELSPKDLKGISIGDKITAKITGVVKRASAGEPGDKHWDGMPPEITLEVATVHIEGSNTFSEMAEEDD